LEGSDCEYPNIHNNYENEVKLSCKHNCNQELVT